jgi:hypothetical protein
MDMEVAGFVELQQLIEQLGKVPQKVATKAAGAGALGLIYQQLKLMHLFMMDG